MLSNEEREQSHGSSAVRYHPQHGKQQQQQRWGLGLAEVRGQLKLTEQQAGGQKIQETSPFKTRFFPIRVLWKYLY